MYRKIKILTALILVLILSACISYKPIFDDNLKFKTVGEKTADSDFKLCKSQAEKYLKNYKAKRIGNEVARKALFGGILGGVMGLIFGNTTKSLATGAVSGALFGGVYGGASVMAEDNLKPDEIKQSFITRCLNQKGYNIIGWY